MAYDKHLEERIERIFQDNKINYIVKQMMGGICFLVNDKMCVGVIKNNLMIRIDPEIQSQLLKKEGCRVMDFTGRPMKGYLFVEPVATDLDTELEYWIQLCLDFNPTAKSSKKKL